MVRWLVDGEQLQVEVDQVVIYTLEPSVLDRSPVLSHVLKSTQNDGDDVHSMAVPAGYSTQWLSYVTGERDRRIFERPEQRATSLVKLLKVRYLRESPSSENMQ